VKFVRKAALLVLFQPVIVAEAFAHPSDRGADVQLVLRQREGHVPLRIRGKPIK
jgi:hypothetical protein